MADEHQLGAGDGPTVVTFAQFESARDSKAVDKIEAGFRDVLDDNKNTIDSLDALPRSTAFEPDREKLVATFIAAWKEISHLRSRSLGDRLRFKEICDDLSARISSFRRRWTSRMTASFIA